MSLPKFMPINFVADLKPISDTPILSRIVESVVVKVHIFRAIPPNAIHDQYGFKPTGSTNAAIIYITNTVSIMLQNNKYEHCLMIEFSKAGFSREPGKKKSRNFNLALLFVFKLFLTFCFFLLLYLLVRTYTTIIRAPSYQNFHHFSISFDNPLTTLCCLPFTGPHYRSSYTCSQLQLATQRSYQPHSGFNHAPS